VVTVLNQIYEEDFVGFSHGFRPGRSQHQAPVSSMDALWVYDIVAGFLQQWKDRLEKFGLELHPDKTRLIEFGREAGSSSSERRFVSDSLRSSVS
jgi:hypothetical protein